MRTQLKAICPFSRENYPHNIILEEYPTCAVDDSNINYIIYKCETCGNFLGLAKDTSPKIDFDIEATKQIISPQN